MIRNAKSNDRRRIDEIGALIKEDFVNKYDISSFLNYEYSKLYVYEEEKVIGFIQLEEHFEIIDLINIAVDEEYHGKNIGTKLIEYALSNTNAEKMMLEVRESNISAIKLYEKVGFKEINRRKKYYGNEDAIIMERII